MRFASLLAASTAVALGQPAAAQQATTANSTGERFGLGDIVVTGQRAEGIAIGEGTLSNEAIQAFNRNTLDEAVNLIPGVNSGNSGGSRNERLIFVRGFNRFQVPLSIDGIRVYLPADNRLDFGRFLTPDIAEIQVAKGYVSVLDGPDGMGGAINLVTRRPGKALDVEMRGTIGLGRDADYEGYTLSGLIGARQDNWYAQVSGARNFQKYWDLAGGFTPTATEDGGHRDLSRTADWRLNGRVGITPSATDEYALSFTRQEGSKLAPVSVSDPLSTQRFWTWPDWNISSLYFLSTTALGDMVTIKTRAFYTTFYNLLRSFDSRNENSQTLGRAFNSPYRDKAWGGSVELDLKPFAGDTLALSAHYRRDRHVEAQQSYPGGTIEPDQASVEDTYSLAAENRYAFSPALSLTSGVGYDWRRLREAEDYGAPLGTNPATTPSRIFSYPLADTHVWNGQGRLDWTGDDGVSAHASVSSRGRFPTLFERFSQRFGASIPNPSLKPERATNYELGAGRDAGGMRMEGAIFHSRVSDAIVSYPTLGYPCTGSTIPGACTPANLVQSRNLGHGDYYGAEASIEAKAGSNLTLGANYTYTHRKLIDPSSAAFRPTDVPTHKAFLYADWSPLARLHVLPSADIASDRWTVTTVVPVRYYRTGSYVNAGLRFDYEVIPGVDIGVGARNLFDDQYRLVDGFPEPGRSLFATARTRF